MAVTYTFTPDRYDRLGSRKARWGTLTLTGTYTSGGDAVTASVIPGLVTLESLVFQDAATSIGQVPRFIESTGKVVLQRYDGASAGKANLEEVAAGTTVTGTIRVIATGH